MTRQGERVIVIGAGLVGLAVARELSQSGRQVTVVDKEPHVAAHQSSHNSGVVHAGLYYKPGSLRAQLCREGGALLREYCRTKGIAFDDVGKIVVATTKQEVTLLDDIERRAHANGVPGLERLGPEGITEVEPNAAGISALRSPQTAIVDFKGVALALADDVTADGGDLRLGQAVTGVTERGGHVEVTVGPDRFIADRLVVCAGLQTDALANMVGRRGSVRVIPFRGLYWQLEPEARDLVKGLIYPVADPRYPFLGIHFTRIVNGQVLVGPNAVLALAMEGYDKGVALPDVAKFASWPGFWRMAAGNWRRGLHEVIGSSSRSHFTERAQRLVPSLEPQQLLPAWSGVRAQAVDRSGALVDDFVIDTSSRIQLVRNAPSPAATSCLAIGKYLASHLAQRSTNLT